MIIILQIFEYFETIEMIENQYWNKNIAIYLSFSVYQNCGHFHDPSTQ